ncbi:hypothetical protein WA026_005983 [Henosepilachna vigintioctopunctata]|uniref:Uncharacterized protein n=1 Tax=Henosepilachna vigintioctopunctata TaxID=420089 RepID=A0AAW1U5N3_9CUCU
MFLFHIALAALAVSNFVECSIVSPSQVGAYKNIYNSLGVTRKDESEHRVETARLHYKDATNEKHSTKSSLRHSSSTDFSNIQSRQHADNTQEKHQRKSTSGSQHKRNKRSYYPYSPYNYQVPQFQSLSAWRPSVYPLQRPYFIPVFGIEGRIPIYIAQQPVYLNPGTPPHNPEKPPYVGPTYLPPVGPTYLPPPVTSSPPSNGTTMETGNRFGGNDDDDRPVWDRERQPSVPSTTQASIQPTRKPQSGPKTFPPLVHKDVSDESSSNQISTESNRRPITTTEAPSRAPPGPSRCVWAIVSCCSTSSKAVSINCFEQFGCSGPFWDVSPCETEYAKAAIESALNFYNTRS